MNLKMSLIYVKYDIKYFLHNCRYYYKYRFVRAKRKNVLYFIFEPNSSHPGLADRMKAIISLYNVAKAAGYQMRIYFETPFLLSDYLQPRQDWVASLDELEYSIFDTRIINETNWRPIKRLKANKQYHCYNYAGNDIPWEFKDTKYRWHELFHELFMASEKLEKAYRSLGLPDKRYVSVHLRFVNALERFENSFFENHIDNEEGRKKLIEKCKQGIREICDDNNGIDVYVFSDSKLFLDSLSDIPVKTLDSNNIGHISMEKNQNVQLKTFIDLYVMSKSQAIYRIRAQEIYNLSCFALLASRIGNVPFIDKNL